jgi:hypothetical protein
MVKFCTRNDECGSDGRCDFTASRCIQPCKDLCDCEGPNARCDIGMCQQMCLVNAECQTGEICSLSRARCLTVPCSNDADCFPEEECLIQREPRYVSKPAMAELAGTLTAWVDMDVHGQRMIFSGRAASPKAVSFQARAVLQPPQCIQDAYCDEYRSPSVVRTPQGYAMFFVKSSFWWDSSQPPQCGNGECELGESQVGRCPDDCATEGIMRATSTDGVNWIVNPADAQGLPVALLLPYYTWEGGKLDSPMAVIDRYGYLRLYYEADNGNAIGVALAQDSTGSLWEPTDRDPPDAACGTARCRVLVPDQLSHQILWREVRRVRTPFVMLEEDFEGHPYFRMWFSAWGFESPTATSFGTVEQIPGNYSIGYAASENGTTWEIWPFNPVFDRIKPNTFVNHTSELDPMVLRWRGKYYLFYSGAERDGQSWENMGVAVNPPSATGK